MEKVFTSKEAQEIVGCTPGFLKDLVREKKRRGSSGSSKIEKPLYRPQYSSGSQGSRDYYSFADLMIIYMIRLYRDVLMSRKFIEVIRQVMDQFMHLNLGVMYNNFTNVVVSDAILNSKQIKYPNPFEQNYLGLGPEEIPEISSIQKHTLNIDVTSNEVFSVLSLEAPSDNLRDFPVLKQTVFIEFPGQEDKGNYRNSEGADVHLKIVLDISRIHIHLKRRALGKGILKQEAGL